MPSCWWRVIFRARRQAPTSTGPPDSTPRFPDAQTALSQGLYQLWDADTAVEQLGRLLEQYPQIRDVHFWAQLPGEPFASGQRRIEYMARHALPRLRERL